MCAGQVTAPKLKIKWDYVNGVNNYRAITVIPVIYKVLEEVILVLCDEYFITDSLQFGSKRGI
jgi:hypothetical protein